MRSRTPSCIRLIATTLVLTWLCVPAHADNAILFVGKVQARERGVIATAIADSANQLGWTFAERTFPENERDDILACMKLDRPATCLDRPLQLHKIDRLVVVQVGSEPAQNGKAPDVIITQQVVAPGAAVVFIQRRTCEQCDDAMLRQQVSAMTKKLLEDAASGTSKTVLTIKSDPPGAWITLDGDTAGSTNSTLATFPGKHTVMLRATGYETEVRDVTAVEGQSTELVVKLRPTAGVLPTNPIERPSRVVPYLVVGAGVAAVIAGGLLIAIDEDPDAGPGSPFEIRNTAPTGVGFAVAGVVVVGIGVYLVVRSSRSSKVSRPTAALSSGSAVLGWETRF